LISVCNVGLTAITPLSTALSRSASEYRALGLTASLSLKPWSAGARLAHRQSRYDRTNYHWKSCKGFIDLREFSVRNKNDVPDKGFGFVQLADGSGDAFLYVSVVASIR
jgi:hypothetical protein